MKKWIFLVMLVMLISNVNARTFEENTTFSQNNINYEFIEGLNIVDFEILPGGIKINDDKIGLTIQGGELTVRFYQFNNEKKISFQSTVPQKIEFQITSNGIKQYLYDEKIYYLNDYNIGLEEVIFEIYSYKDTGIDTKSEVKSPEKLKWYEQKFFEIETSSEIDEKGIIHGETFTLSYIWFTILMIILLSIFMIWWSIR